MKFKNKTITTDTFALDYQEEQLTLDISGTKLLKTINNNSHPIHFKMSFNKIYENQFDFERIISNYDEEQFKTCSFILDAVRIKMNIFGKKITPNQAKDIISIYDSTLHINNYLSDELKVYWGKKCLQEKKSDKFFENFNLSSFDYIYRSIFSFNSLTDALFFPKEMWIRENGLIWAVNKDCNQYIENIIRDLMILINQFPFLDFVISISQKTYHKDDYDTDKRKFTEPFFGIQVKNKKIRLLTVEETKKLCNEYLNDGNNTLFNYPMDYNTAISSQIPRVNTNYTLKDLEYAFNYFRNIFPQKRNLSVPIANNMLKLHYCFEQPDTDRSVTCNASHLVLIERFLTYTSNIDGNYLKIAIPLEYAFEHIIDINKYIDIKPILFKEINEDYEFLRRKDLGFGVIGQSIDKNNALTVIRDLDTTFYHWCYDNDKRNEAYQLPTKIRYISEFKDYLKTKYPKYDPLELDIFNIKLCDDNPNTWIHPNGNIWMNYTTKIPNHIITFITECYLIGRKFPFLDFVVYFIQNKQQNNYRYIKRTPLFGIHVTKGKVHLLNSEKTLLTFEQYRKGLKFYKTFSKKVEYSEKNYFSVKDMIHLLNENFDEIK